jgi:SAM-dependent methyltransferase
MAEILQLVDLDQLRKEVRRKYREVAEAPTASYHFHTGRAHALRLGYPPHPLDELPEEACEAFAGVGNPFFWGVPQPGEKVVDLGSGAGMDSLLAALWVGPEGRVIGVDMTPEMLERRSAFIVRSSECSDQAAGSRSQTSVLKGRSPRRPSAISTYGRVELQVPCRAQGGRR